MRHALLLVMLGTSLPFSWIHVLALTHLTPPELIEAEEAIFTETALLQNVHSHIDMLSLSNVSSMQFTKEEHVAHTTFLEDCLKLQSATNLFLQALRELRALLEPLHTKSIRKETAASSRNKLVEILLKIKRLTKDFWDFPEVTPLTIKNLIVRLDQIPGLSHEEKISLHDFTDASDQWLTIQKKLTTLARTYARTIKRYQDERRKNYVSVQAFSHNSVTDDFPETNNVGIVDHDGLRQWVEAMIEPLYTKGSNLTLVAQCVHACYGTVGREESLRRAAADLTRTEKELYKNKELFEGEGSELLRLQAELEHKIGEYQRACTHGATSQLCYLYKHTIPLAQYKLSVLRLRDALIPAVAKILIFLIDLDHNQLKLYAETLDNALACLSPVEKNNGKTQVPILPQE